jgi:hypothetical protein
MARKQIPKMREEKFILKELQIDSMYLQQVQFYKYFGSTVNSDNSIEDEIQYRITLGNKVKQCFFKSRPVSKKSKLKLYWSIMPVPVAARSKT